MFQKIYDAKNLVEMITAIVDTTSHIDDLYNEYGQDCMSNAEWDQFRLVSILGKVVDEHQKSVAVLNQIVSDTTPVHMGLAMDGGRRRPTFKCSSCGAFGRSPIVNHDPDCAIKKGSKVLDGIASANYKEDDDEK